MNIKLRTLLVNSSRALALTTCLLQTTNLTANTVENIGFTPMLKGTASEALSSVDQYVTPMGFHIDTVNPSTTHHWQGITRHPSNSAYYYVAKGGTNDVDAGLFTVLMNKGDLSSSFVGNLLMEAGKDAVQVDPGNSKVINEQIRNQSNNPDCYHYGGLQAAGNPAVTGQSAIVAIGLEDCHSGSSGIADRIAIWDVTNPSIPTFAGEMRINAPGSDKVYSTGAIQIQGDFANPNADYFLIFVNGAISGSYNKASMYVVQLLSGMATFYEDDEPLFSLNTSTLPNWDQPQNSSLIADKEGRLHVVTTNNVATGNQARSYEITNLTIDPITFKVSGFDLVYKEERQFRTYNSGSGSSDFGDFYKGAGLNVGAHGGLNIYAIENASDGINGSVLAGEFVGRTYDSQTNCDTNDGAYAVFYRDTHFKGKNLTMSYLNVEAGNNDLRDLAAYSGSINNNISSMKVCLPAGCNLALYNSGSSNSDEKVIHSPQVRYLEFPDLSYTTFPSGDSLNDTISGVTLQNLQNCGVQ